MPVMWTLYSYLKAELNTKIYERNYIVYHFIIRMWMIDDILKQNLICMKSYKMLHFKKHLKPASASDTLEHALRGHDLW